MAINVQITGVKEVNHLLLTLPQNMESEIMVANNEFARFVQRSAKLRAPRDTGNLSRSIVVTSANKKITITVESPYGIFQEFGFRPHFVHANMSDRMGSTIGARLGKKGFIFVQGFKPFISPALEMAIARLPMMMQRAAEKAVVKSRR